MNKLEVFFDYVCPYCFRGFEYLRDLIYFYPHIEVIWNPCEAHPLPENHGPHTDLCIQGMFYAYEHGVNLWDYNARMFKAVQKDGANIESLDVIARYASGLVNRDDFKRSIKRGIYLKVQQGSNEYAYEKSGILTLPSYRLNGGRLNAVENIGITKRQLAGFLSKFER